MRKEESALLNMAESEVLVVLRALVEKSPEARDMLDEIRKEVRAMRARVRYRRF